MGPAELHLQYLQSGLGQELWAERELAWLVGGRKCPWGWGSGLWQCYWRDTGPQQLGLLYAGPFEESVCSCEELVSEMSRGMTGRACWCMATAGRPLDGDWSFRWMDLSPCMAKRGMQEC